MAPREIRSSTVGEVRTLSLASLYDRMADPAKAKLFLESLQAGRADALVALSKAFVPVGLAKQVRIDEDWGTQAIYGIGDPTRPTLIPGNYSVSASIERLQLDGRNNFSYVTSPDYWYSKYTQRLLGNTDWGMYTYLYIHDREHGPSSFNKVEIYALLPRSASKAISSGDVMVVHNVQMIGFKYQYMDFVADLLGGDSGIMSYGRTVVGEKEQSFGNVVKGVTKEGKASSNRDQTANQNNAGGR